MSNNLQILSNVEVHSKTGSKSKVSKNKVLNLGHLNFDIVSNFVLRISYFSHRDTFHASRNRPLHLSRELYKSTLFMQNKAKLQNDKMNVTPLLTNYYEHFRPFVRRKNEPKRTQNEPNFRPKLGSFSPKLALFYKEIFAFAKKLNRFADLQDKNAEHSCGRRIFCRNSLLFKSKNPENTKVSETLSLPSVPLVAKYNFINPVILSEKNINTKLKILILRHSLDILPVNKALLPVR